MGVQGLWELLALVGRRVSVETLAGKKLAIDASIWMVQFMKAMRDDNGDMVRNAHLLGFFRRICKLLFLRTKPVFVFDGATPALKRRTVASRRRNRDQAQAKIRKTAEKLLLNHLKTRRLEELAEEVKRQRQTDDNAKGKKPVKGKGKQVVEDTAPASASASNQESLDELLARSLAAEEETGCASAGVADEEDDDEEEEMIFPVTGDKIDPTVLASLPPSMQLDLLVQMRERLMAENRQKYQKIKKVPTKFSELQIQSYLKTVAFRREIDQVQKCAAGRGIGGVQSSRIASEANREFIFSSSFTGDKQMLTTPGVQVNGKTGVQANTKTDHTLVKKSITTDFVKSISPISQSKSTTDASDGKLTADFGDDVETYCDERGRVRVSRVRALGMRMTRDLQRNLDFMKEYEQEKRRPDSCTIREPSCTKDVWKVSNCHSEVFHAERAASADNAEDIEAISRNIDLLEKHVGDNHLDKPSMLGSEAAIEISFSEDDGMESTDDYFLNLASGSSALKLLSKSVDSDGNKNESDSEFAWEEGSVHNKENLKDDHQGSFAPLVGKSSFEEDEIDWEDGTLCLNSQEGTLQLPKFTSHSQTEPENVVSKGQFDEEADIQEAIRISLQEGSIQTKESWNDDHQQNCASLAGKSSLEEDEVDWEDGTLCLNSEEGPLQLSNITSHSQAEHENVASNRQLEEEANIQEAIRRSLDDFKTPRSLTISDANICANLGMSGGDENSIGPLDNFKVDNSELDVHVPLKVSPERTSSHSSSKDGLGHIDFACGKDVCRNSSPGMHLPSATSALYGKSSSIDELNKNLLVSSVIDNGTVDMLNVNNVLGMHPHEGQFTQIDQCINASKQAEDERHAKISSTNFPESTVDISLKTTSNMEDTVLPDYKQFDASKSNHSGGRHENADSQKISLAGKSVINQEPEQFMEKDNGVHTIEPDNLGETTTQEYLHDHKEVSQANLDEEISFLRQERIDLGDEQRKLERNAESVSSEMFAECQELLQMFGLPYIIAPTEAEAQCAHMELLKLVDGVVTDDSDVFLFGARSVYKNIFDDRKYVETYLMKDIESELGLNRDKLIHMAMLLGSDYTEGVSGIGIVNAIEVMRAFPEEDGLQKFREWVESPDPSILGKLDPQNGSKLNRTPTKASKREADQMQNSLGGLSSEDTSRGNGDQPSVDATSDIKNIFMSKHRAVSKNWHIPATFPSDLVISAYTSPQVDKSTDTFSWGRPDLVLLRKLCWERFGWNNQKADELLVPVLKEHSKHETQLRLEAFYTFNERFAKIRSKRIKKAVKGITGTSASELMYDHVHDESNSQIKKRSKPLAEEPGKPEKNSDEKTPTRKKAPKLLKRKNAGNRDVHLPDGAGEAGDSVNPDQDGQNTESGTRASIRGRGRGRGRGRATERGRGRGKGRGRGLGKEHQSTEGSSSYESNGASEMQEHAKEPEATSGSRRSTRQRKQVKYSEESVEANDLSTLSSQKEAGGLCEAAMEQGRLEKDNSATDVDASGLEDCYFSGGGFCVDDESDLNVGASQATAASASREFVDKSSEAIDDVSDLGDDKAPLEDRSSRAYLYGGGGFCVDESDEAQPTTSPVKDTVEKSSEGASDSGTKRARDIVEDSSIDEKERKSGLTAMPWLRRKRRKV